MPTGRFHDRNAYPVTSLAVLGDLSPDWRPDRYEQEGLGHSLCFKFQTVKLLDYEDQLDSLLASDNPFGLFIAAHLKTLRTKGDPEKRAHWKQQLFRLAIQKNMALRWVTVDDIYKYLNVSNETVSVMTGDFVSQRSDPIDAVRYGLDDELLKLTIK